MPRGHRQEAGRGLDALQALSIALEAEHSAILFYDALADTCSGEASAFFRGVMGDEERHAAHVSKMLETATGASGARG